MPVGKWVGGWNDRMMERCIEIGGKLRSKNSM